MLEIIFVLLFLFTIVLMFYGLQSRAPYVVFLTVILWFLLGWFILQGIDIPYEMYNPTSGVIETGVHTIHSDTLNALSYLFIGLGIVSFVFFITFMLEYLYKPPKEL